MSVVDLAGLTTSGEGFSLIGENASDAAGLTLSSAGDINGDGFDDYIIGAYANDEGGTNAGAAYVIFGHANGFGDIDLGNIAAGAGFKIVGAAAGDAAGFGVSDAGDINGDGYDDIIVGAEGAAGGTGAAYVIFGKASGFADINLGSLAAADGFKITGAEVGDNAGIGVSSAGDVNGDGYDDIIVGAPGAGATDSGAAYVIFGKASGFADIDLTSLSAADGFKITGGAATDLAGRSVSSAGDVNGDGFDDILVGAYLNDAGGTNAGAAYVIFGKASGLADVDLSTLGSSDGFSIAGDTAYDYTAKSVSSAGDINGDGFDDIIIGAAGNDVNGSASGVAYVIYGKASGFGNIDLGSLTSADGFRITGTAANDYTGFSVASAGDVNGDGFDDLIVGAPLADGSGRLDAGTAWIIYGKAGHFSGVDLRTLSDADGFKIIGAAAGDAAGAGVSAAGDINGDGFADLIVGALANDAGGTDAGAAYVIFGQAPTEDVSRTGTDMGQTIRGGAFDDTLDGRGGDDFLYAAAGNDTLLGGTGNDFLDGGTGADTMFGGTGNDSYVVNSINDVLVERSGEGTDTVDSSITYTLGANLENLTLTGTGAINGTGNSLNNVITGNSGANHLDGGTGNDIVNGGAGNDTLIGGSGTDTLDGGGGSDSLNGGLGLDTATYFDAAAGVTVKIIAGAQNTIGAGTDTLAGIENLTGSAFADNLTGDATANVLTGNDGNDVLTGLAGKDHLVGGNGNDVLDGGDGNDALTGGLGVDTASYASAAAGVTVSLALTAAQATGGAGDDTLSGIENLTGSGFNDTLTGSTLANTIVGGAGDDQIDGRAGIDVLTGGAGADSFLFSTKLNASTNVDTITDFVVADDTILLSSTIFAAAGADGTLSAAAFHSGTAAADADDRIIYNQSTGQIYYDADGNGAGAKILFATVTPGTALTNADFSVVGASTAAASVDATSAQSATTAEAAWLDDSDLSRPGWQIAPPDSHAHLPGIPELPTFHLIELDTHHHSDFLLG